MNNDKIIISLVVLGVVTLLTALAFNFLYAEGPMRQIYVGILALLTVGIFSMFPRAALVTLTMLVFSVRWFTDTLMILPREASWMVDVFIIIVVIRSAFFTFRHGRRPVRVEIVIFLLLAFGVFTSLVNNVGYMSVLVGARLGFRYLMLFIAVLHLDISVKWLRRYLVFLFVIGVIQIPIAYSQFLKIGWVSPDMLTGSFGQGQTPGIGLFMLLLVSYLFARMLETGRLRISYILIIGWLSISCVLGEVKYYFLFMPLLLIFMVRSVLLRRPAVAFGVFVTVVALFFAVDYAVVSMKAWKTGRTPVALIQNFGNFFSREMEVAEYERYERTFHYNWMLYNTVDRPRDGLLGYGIGSATESAFSTTHSKMLSTLTPLRLTSANTTSIVWLILEYGFVGLGLILYLFLLIYRRGRILMESDDSEERILGRFLQAITVAFIAWMFYTSAWQHDSMSFTFWPLAAMLVRLSYTVEARQKAAKGALAASPVTEGKAAIPQAAAG